MTSVDPHRCRRPLRDVWVLALLLSLAFARPIFAQVSGGILTGLVSDPTGAALPGVTVTVVNSATGVSTTAVTNATGVYEFPPLIPGTYEMTATMSGFTTYTHRGIRLALQQRLALDFSMQIGAVAERVEVEGTPSLLDTETAKTSHLVSGEMVANLPFNGRNMYMVTRLVPGVTTTAAAEGLSNPFDTFGASNISVNGAPVQANAILQDGIVNQFGNGALGFASSTEAVQEMTVQSFALSAEHGQTGGTVVSVESKSGTNRPSGSLYYFHNDNSLRANDYFGKKFGQEKSPNNINQFGGTFGGPVYIPGLFNGTNRTFFFFNYEGIREKFGYRRTNTVPTTLERQGDFSQTRAANGELITIYNPFTTRPDPARPGQFIRDPFPNNQIPAAMLNPIATNLLRFVPLPNLPGTVNNHLFTSAYTENSDNYHVRFDHRLSGNDTIYATFGRIKRLEDFFANFPTGVTGWLYTTESQLWAFGYTRVLNPTTMLNVRLGVPYTAQSLVPRTTAADRASLGFPDSFTSLLRAPDTDFPSISNSDMTGFGQTTSNWRFYTSALRASGSKIAGRHSVAFGYEFRLARANVRSGGGGAGSFSFDRRFTQGPTPNVSRAVAGHSVASMLLGTPSGGSVSLNADSVANTEFHGLYLQDNWRLTNKLSLNLGIRWDYETPVQERDNRMNRGFDRTADSPIAAAAEANYAQNPIPEVRVFDVRGGLRFVGEEGSTRYNFEPRRNAFMPRLGLAYTLTPKTVARAGYGLFYIPLRDVRGFGVSQANLPMTQVGFSSSTGMVTTLDSMTPFNTLSNPFPQGLVQPVGSSLGPSTLLGQSITVADSDARRARSHMFQLSVQRELPGDVLVDVGYVGSRISNLPVDEQINGVPLQYLSLGNALNAQVPNPFRGLIAVGPLSQPLVARSQLLRPYPHLQNVNLIFRPIGRSWYDSLQVSGNKRFGAGFSTLVSYTWAKNMQERGFLNFGEPLERVIVPIDRTHRLTFSGLWEVPIGAGRRFGSNLPVALRHAVGGWNVSWISTFTSGQPVGGWANAVQTRPLEEVNPTIEKWFDTGAFAPQPPFTRRELSSVSSQIRADGTQNVDVMVGKEFPMPVRDGALIEAQVQIFNVFDTTQFGSPNTSVTSSAFGTVTSQANQPRIIQLALKLKF